MQNRKFRPEGHISVHYQDQVGFLFFLAQLIFLCITAAFVLAHLFELAGLWPQEAIFIYQIIYLPLIFVFLLFVAMAIKKMFTDLGLKSWFYDFLVFGLSGAVFMIIFYVYFN